MPKGYGRGSGHYKQGKSNTVDVLEWHQLGGIVPLTEVKNRESACDENEQDEYRRGS